MGVRVALLRGINVGGHNRLPMADLRALLMRLGCTGVRTHIQSGNCVLHGPDRSDDELARAITEAIAAAWDFKPRVMVFDAELYLSILAAAPFADADRATVHLFFHVDPAEATAHDRLAALRRGAERVHLAAQCLWLHAPDGIGRSALAAGAERALGVPVTARNLRTARAIADLVRAG